jgi:hypothetical protein
VHNEPLGVNEHARWLWLVERPSMFGAARLVEMQMPMRKGSSEACEALGRCVSLHERVSRLADQIAKHARHPAEIPTVIVKS